MPPLSCPWGRVNAAELSPSVRAGIHKPHEVPVTKAKLASTIASQFCIILSIGFFQPPETTAFCFEEAAGQYGLNPSLLRSIASVESRFQPAALHQNSNGSTDFGLMQVNSSWIDKLGLDPGRLLRDPCYNVMTGAKILRQCVDRFGYTWEAVGCYNASSRDKRVNYSWKILRELKKPARKVQTADAGTDSQADAACTKSRTAEAGAKPKAKRTSSVDTAKRPQSLYFRVRANVMRGELENP
jgi:hypothetical protein